MKRLRMVLVLAVTVGTLVVVLRLPLTTRGFATPAACLETYREAGMNGDVPAYLNCIGEPLRSEIEARYRTSEALGEHLRRDMRDIKSWAELDTPRAHDAATFVDVEEIRVSGKRRIRYRLEQSPRGWLIVGREQREEKSLDIPFGTHIGQVGNDPAAP